MSTGRKGSSPRKKSSAAADAPATSRDATADINEAAPPAKKQRLELDIKGKGKALKGGSLSREDPVGPSRSGVELLDQEVLALVEQLKPTEATHKVRLDAIECLDKLVKKIWPGAEVVVYGSSKSRMYLPDGDIDVVVLHDPLLPYRTSSHLNALERNLISSRFSSPSQIFNIKRARVPLCKFTSTPQFGGFDFDVSINGTSGIEGGEEVERLLEEVEEKGEGNKERVVRLVLLVKLLLGGLRLSDPSQAGLGGTAVFCMCLSFVQLDKRPATLVSPGQDLLALLQYYGVDHDVAEQSISVAEGGAILPRVKQAENDNLRAFSILNPLEPEKNVSASCSKTPQIREAFTSAHALLLKSLSAPSPSPSSPSLSSALSLAGLSPSPSHLTSLRSPPSAAPSLAHPRGRGAGEAGEEAGEERAGEVGEVGEVLMLMAVEVLLEEKDEEEEEDEGGLLREVEQEDMVVEVEDLGAERDLVEEVLVQEAVEVEEVEVEAGGEVEGADGVEAEN
ncbi:hypothetical protein JCM11251_000099 [Rhodosporidiobolus azoricus]